MAQKVGRRDFVRYAALALGMGKAALFDAGCASKKVEIADRPVDENGEPCIDEFCENFDKEGLDRLFDEMEQKACGDDSYEIIIILNQPMLYVFRKGRVEKQFPIGVGTYKTPTPTGNFAIKDKIKDPPWYIPQNNKDYGGIIKKYPQGHIPGDSQRNPIQKYWIELRSIDNPELNIDFGLHGTNNPKSIEKKYVSHGCIRMTDEGILYVAEKIPLGTVVRIMEEYPVEILNELFDCSAYDINKNVIISEPKSL